VAIPLAITQLFPESPTNTGAMDGQCTAVIVGGFVPYTVSSDGITYFPGTSTVFNLFPGNYTFYAKDAHGTIVTAPFTIPEFPQIIDLSTTNETSISAHDGSVTFSLTGGTTPYFYSIDDLNYTKAIGNPQVVSNIPHGVYTLYVYDSQNVPVHIQAAFTIFPFAAEYGCTDPAASNYNPNAQINNGTCIYPDPTNDPEQVNNLYEAPDEFRLITQVGDTYQIDEPKDWDKITIVLLRDKVYHGVNYEFSEGDIKLRFDDDAGQQLLQAEYNKYGNDAITRFQFGYDNFGSFIVYLDAYIDYNTYEVQEFYTVVGVKRKTFNDLLDTRKDTVVNVNNAQTIDLFSKQIQMSTVVNEGFKTGALNTLQKNSWPGNITGHAPYLGYTMFLDFSAATNNDLAPEAPLWGVYAENPEAVSEYLFKATGDGDYTFNLSFEARLNIKILAPTLGIDNSRHGYYSLQWAITINEGAQVYPLGTPVTGFTNSRINGVQFTGSIDKTITLNMNDRVYLFGTYICEDRGNNGNGVQASLDIHYSNINITGNTTTVATKSPMSLGYETVNALINYNTGFTAGFKSNLLGRTDIGYPQDGCAALLAYTNGYQVRGFDQTVRPMQLTYKDYIEGLNAAYCIGMGYEVNPLGNFLVRLEKAEYFYQDVEIALFSEVSNYVEDIDSENIFNKLEFGYQKFTQNLPSSKYTLDEFNTDHVYLTPIQSISNTLTQVCKQITSGYAIELTRRQQFADTPSDSWTYDDDVFIIACVKEASGGYAPERLENFIASGILSPETAYNIRMSPERMLSRWGKFVNSGLAYKKPSDQLINTYVAKNGNLQSQYTGNDDCDSTQVFLSGANVHLSDLVSKQALFMPEKITFDKRISWQTLSLLRRCSQGLDTEGRNNGYISVVDPTGITKRGYLTELKYNPETELANFTLRKKFVNLSVPFDCSAYSTDSFAQFEATTGLPAEIEQCIFSNFA
jgi:hypothetical protein